MGGESDETCDCSAVPEQLHDVQCIYSTFGAFAALKTNGSVVTWGRADLGGDCTGVQEHLHDVHCIYSTAAAFAAVTADGSVVTWGSTVNGDGEQSAVQCIKEEVG